MCQIQAYLSKTKEDMVFNIKGICSSFPNPSLTGDKERLCIFLEILLFRNIVLYFNQGVVLCPVSLKVNYTTLHSMEVIKIYDHNRQNTSKKVISKVYGKFGIISCASIFTRT